MRLIAAGQTDKLPAGGEILSLLEEHTKQFSWLTYGYEGPAMSLDDLFELIRDNLQAKEGVKTLRDKLLNQYDEVKREKARLIREEKIPAATAYLFEVMAELMYIKDYRKGIYQRSYLAMDNVVMELAKRLGLTLREVKYLTYDEVEEVLSRRGFADYKIAVQERFKECCYVVTKGKIKVFQGEECRKMIAEKVGSDKSDKAPSKVLKGTTAYYGKVTGTARIVLVKADVSKIHDGEILVSSATNPDLILAMKKAAGIVTDTGGIISHAAIVSRELKKPCVVGTQFATKAISDGDLVELDADKGIVTILKKHDEK